MVSMQSLEKAIREDFKKLLWEIFKKYKVLTISTNWEVLDKTYGEVGGRFLEDFLLSGLKKHIGENGKYNVVDVYAPDGRRTMEDIIAEWEVPNIPRQKLLISIKGHKSGSQSSPNLVSLKKSKEFYAKHPENSHFILLVIHYVPERIVDDGFHMSIEEMDLFHLKDLEDRHFSLQTIGSGGQFLLNGINNIQESYRTAKDFYKLIVQKERIWLKRRINK
ncbi:MAG: hypothetical protein KF758_03895 [Anaerolineales bacterium]|nr:hypothetical protein [Anaerolineales bacterium]